MRTKGYKITNLLDALMLGFKVGIKSVLVPPLVAGRDIELCVI
jgi:hypothetical protein